MNDHSDINSTHGFELGSLDDHENNEHKSGAGSTFEHVPYIENTWNNHVMPNSNPLIYDMEFPAHIEGAVPANNIVHNIQYQNPVSPGMIKHEDMKPRSKIRPCDHCRRRKTKCVLVPGTNNCEQCEAKSIECTYVGRAVKRKPPSGSDEPIIKKQKEQVGFDPKSIAPNVPIRDVAPIRDYSIINNSLLKKTLSLQFPRSSFYVGPTSYVYDFNLLNIIIDSANVAENSNKIEQINLSESISLRKVSREVQFILKDDQSPQSHQIMSNDVDAIEKFVAPHGQILIDLYFRIIHPSYPILHKKVFLEKYSRTHREFSAPLLAAVYVLAIQWWDYDPSLNRFPKPNVEMILKIGLNNYLLEILKRPKLSAVQAGLLLLQCKHIVRVSRQNPDDELHANNGRSIINDLGYSDWVLCCQVVALADELGLGLDCTDWKLPKWERGLRKRLAWAVYIEDKWLSLKNSRPSHIHDEKNWMVNALVEEDFPEKHGDGDLKEGSSDIDNGKQIFMKLIELSQILSDIVDNFYSMKAINVLNDDVTQILKQAKPIQLRLREWYHQLPIELQMSSVQSRKLCSNGYLHLAYFATELTLHRKLISTIHSQLSSGKKVASEIINLCRAAASSRLSAAIDFVKSLKPEHIHSFWHSASASNFTLIGTFASILFVTSMANEESLFFKDQIFNYRWILKISSKGFHQASDALRQLDLVISHIPNLLTDGSDLPMLVPNVDDVPTTRPGSVQSQYQAVPRHIATPSNNGSFSGSPGSIGPSNQGLSSARKINSPLYVRNSKNNHSPLSSQGFSPNDSRSMGPPPSKPDSPLINKSPMSNRADNNEI